MRRFGAIAVGALLAWAALGTPTASGAPRSFMTGFADGIWNDPSTANSWFDRADAAGAQFVLISVPWSAISPRRPPRGTDPSDAANPEYNWGTLDATVRAAVAHRLTVAFTIAGGGGPAWADGPHRPGRAQPGTWRPNAKAFGEFARAVARRYSGTFNPGSGVLPHVRYYQGWSEPNLPNHLTPQWVRVHHRWVAESPIVYRGLLNAFYAGIKSVSRSDVVITGGTAPFGDSPGGARVPPALFWRELFCLSGKRLVPTRCSRPARFDILAHHPYAIGGPFNKSINSDDVSIPDIGKLTRPLHVAERIGHALPRGHKQVWVTEFSWDSRPPDPRGVPTTKRARWIEETFWELWREGVDAIAWFLLADQPPVPSYAQTYQSGMYFLNGRAKPDLQAFRFPFVAEPASRGRHHVWGISPDAGTVRVEIRRAGGWRTLFSLHVRAHAIFTRNLTLAARSVLRAQVGSEVSMTWRVG